MPPIPDVPARRDPPAVPVIAAGLPGSGSTWAFNVLADLLQAGGLAAAPMFANSLDEVTSPVTRAGRLLLKCHTPAASLHVLRELLDCPTLLTVRDPRDGVASLMQRFALPFSVACWRVQASAAQIVLLAASGGTLLLRYEDRFFDRLQTVRELAGFLGLASSDADVARIFDSLTRQSLCRKIGKMVEAGIIDPARPAESFDLLTQWHPGHVGDGLTGKYANVLSAEQQAQVMRATHSFCTVFGYATASPADPQPGCTIGTSVAFGKDHESAAFLAQGWAPPEAAHVWMLGWESELAVPIGGLPADAESVTLCLDLDPIVMPHLPGQRVEITVNGALLLSTLLNRRALLELAVPRALLLQRRPMSIYLHHPDAVRPRDHRPGSQDSRLLSFRLRMLTVRQAVLF